VSGRGRPRTFDVDEALDKAIIVFWRQGYEGTSLDDLTSAMGVSKPSLYAAFGNKEQTFRRAVARYAEIDMAYVGDAIAEPTAARVAERYLRSNVEAITTPGKPPGCLSIQGGLSARGENREVVEFLNQSRARGESQIARRFEAAVSAGDLSASERPAELAKYLSTVSAGLAVQAAAGAARQDLNDVVTRALRAFPGPSESQQER
jgi:AcrR family transcriptional regulator